MGEAGFDRLKTGLETLSILGLLFTLIVMFALKGDLILERPAIILQMAIDGRIAMRGVIPQELAVDSDQFVAELKKRGIPVKGV
jgi:ACR3 family arsenite efflux pump ArsB